MKARKRNVRIFLKDIIDNIGRIGRFTEGITYEEFRTDEKTYFATIQCIEIIGEAAKHIQKPIRSAYPAVPWNDMAGMRDKLIHGYFGTDPIRVWKAAKEDLPHMLPDVEKAFNDLEQDSSGQSRY